uniref:Uncharacterized protein n=1 Tax=Parascaris univalens TaxID=6257 RepID=A0A915CFH2_PARUN
LINCPIRSMKTVLETLMKMDRSLDKPGTSGIGASTQQGPEKFTVKGNEHDGGEREEIVKLWRQIDEKLEHKARNHNLSVVNVKTILHHLIKNPGVISLIMGIDDNASLPDLKLTRSKVKQLCKRNEAKSDVAPHTTEVVVIPRAERTFLDVDYEHNEEYDEDYNPDLDEAEVASEADGDVEVDDTDANPEDTNASLQVVEESENDQPALHTRSRNHVVDDCLEDEPLCGDDVLLFSAIDDPDYVDFISTLNDPSRYEVDEMEDPEYNFMRDLECEETPERDELRMDRATEIPMREVENLLQDLIDSGRMNGSEQTSYSAESAKDCKERKSRKHAKREASRHAWVPQYTDHITVLMGATPDDVDKISLDSAILDGTSIEKPPKFTSSELEQLRIQLKKHVQLLTQFVVGCHFEPSLFDERNECQKMINELHELSASQPSNSVFSIKNLEASIVTCHDAINCERVEFPEVNDPRYKKMNLPLPQTMLVLARSNALLYPELLPTVRLRSFPSFYQYFTAPEESLLAMGQYMFSHIPHSTASKRDGRNALIVRYFLPNKETSQIRLHMKNFRFSPEPIYEIITRAEQGKVTMIFPVEKSDSEQSTPPYMWHRNLQPFWLQLLEKRIFYGSGAFADEAPQRDLASYEGVVITQIPESGAATPCHSSPNKDDAADTCGNEANGFAVSDMSTSEEGSSNSRKRCIHGTRLLKNDFKQRTLEKTNEGAENQNGVGRGGGKKRRKCSSECSMERTDEVAREKCIKLCDDGSLYEHDTDSARGGCGDGAVDSRMDIQKKVIPEYSLSGNSRMRNLTDNIESMDVRWVNDISTKIVHNVRMPKKDCDKVQNNSNDGIVDSSDESLAFGSIEKSSNIQIATSEVQNLHHNTASGSAALIPETAGSCVSVVPSCQVVFVPVLSNVNWLVLTHPPSQAIVGTQLVQPLQVGDTTQDSADALSVGNSSDFVVSAKGAESVAGTDQTHGLSTGTSTLKSSDHELAHETFVHTACVRGRVVPSGNMQDASLEERSCALSVVADADLVQTANISRSENSAAEKNFLANDHKSRSAGSVTKCSSSHGSEVLRLGQDRIMAMLDSGFADTNPKMVTENAQKLPTTENLIEDMPDVDNYEVVKKSGSSDADIVTLREGAVESSKPSGLNDIVDPAEGCSSPPTPEESSSSGLTLLFSGQDDSTRNIREEMSPPHTPCWHHSPGIIDDSASKTRFTDIDGSQAEWRRDEWRPRTPGQPVRPDDRGKRNCTKTKRSLLMNFENMASQRPATVDCGVQWEPVDVSSNHESSSSSNTSLYDVSVEDRLSGSVTQEENEGIIRESLEVKETEGDREGGQPNEEPKCKKRKRKERLRDGLKGMLNGEHRARQMRALSHVILGDFKQKMFMHQHKIQAIQQLITSGPPSTQMFQKLREILGDEHDLLLILVSFLFPEDLISESVLNDPIRKAYASAIEMILNIEAYATFGRSKFSARSIFRYIRELGPFCTSEELQARLYDVVGTEDPLWSALSTYLPTAPHPQM